MRFIPDTNVFVRWVAGRDATITGKMAEHRREIALSSIVFHELAFGAFNSVNVDRNLRQLDGLGLPMLAFDRDDARAAGEIRATLKRRGTPIGPFDVLIAGQALARNFIVVTSNRREFERVDGLAVEDWASGA